MKCRRPNRRSARGPRIEHDRPACANDSVPDQPVDRAGRTRPGGLPRKSGTRERCSHAGCGATPLPAERHREQLVDQETGQQRSCTATGSTQPDRASSIRAIAWRTAVGGLPAEERGVGDLSLAASSATHALVKRAESLSHKWNYATLR